MPLKQIVRQRWTYGAVIFVVVKFNSSSGFLERFPLRALQTCVEPSRVAERTLSAKLASGRCLLGAGLSLLDPIRFCLVERVRKRSYLGRWKSRPTFFSDTPLGESEFFLWQGSPTSNTVDNEQEA